MDSLEYFGGCQGPGSIERIPSLKIRGPPDLVDSMNFAIKNGAVGSNPFGIDYDSASFIMYAEVDVQPQIGPSCGLAALRIVASLFNKHIQLYDILNLAIDRNFSFQGEMFNAVDMACLAQEVLGTNCSVEVNNNFWLSSDPGNIWRLLMENVFIMVPYDNDVSNAPGCRNGEKAHWCLLIGAAQHQGEKYVCAVHGKSAKVSLWKTTDLARSNSQLERSGKSEQQFKLCDLRNNLRGHIILIRFEKEMRLQLAANCDQYLLNTYFS